MQLIDQIGSVGFVCLLIRILVSGYLRNGCGSGLDYPDVCYSDCCCGTPLAELFRLRLCIRLPVTLKGTFQLSWH